MVMKKTSEEVTKKMYQEDVTNSQESIQSLSLWLIHHRNHHKKIVDAWHQVLITGEHETGCPAVAAERILLLPSTASVSHRLTLLYLANDVLQNSKKKGIQVFVEDFEGVLRSCICLLMDDKIRPNVLRVLGIWCDRCVYPPAFIQELRSALPYSETVSNESSATTKIMAEFKVQDVFESLDQMKQLEQETLRKTEDVKGAKLAALNSEILSHLKDKNLGDHLIKEADEASRLLHEVVHALEKEQRHRQNLISCLNKALVYTVVQNNEVDQEFQAFVRIGQNAARVLTILTSPHSSSLPLPSDVPSPTDSDDGPILPPDTLGSKHTSSLDQRLENILCAMKTPQTGLPEAGKPFSTGFNQYQSAASLDQDCRVAAAAGTSNQGSACAGVQPIMPLVSSRPAVMPQPLASMIPGFASSENCEPADMDITNSDDDEPCGPRGPNLRVIEPIRPSEEYFTDGRRLPDASHVPKTRGREASDPSSWHIVSPRSHAPPIHGSRWTPPVNRNVKQVDDSRHERRNRPPGFRYH